MTQRISYEIPTEAKVVDEKGADTPGSHRWKERLGRALEGVAQQIETEGPFVGATATDTAVMLDRIFAKITGA